MLEYFNIKREIFGLDISDLSLKIIQLKKNKQGLELACFGETKIEPDVIKNGEIKDTNKLARIIETGIRQVKGEKINTKYVITSLPEEKAYLQVIQMPKVPEENLKSAVIYEAENYIPTPLDQVYLDFQIVPSLTDNLDHYDILIAALPKLTVDPYVSSLKLAGLEPVALEIESLAIARAIIENQKAESPVLLIDFGATKTSFIIFSGRALRFTSSISVSSTHFTEIISKALKITINKAEALKIKHGLTGKTNIDNKGKAKGKEQKKIFEALIPVLVDLTQQIKKRLEYYRTHASHEHLNPENKEVSKIFLCGGGSNLKGLDELLSMELKIPVEIGNPWINISGKKQIQFEKEQSLAYTTALGLSLRAMKENNEI
ncbi:MAG: type IV pilus assembly protein PilM [Patescibacteria group bacterium]|nr:type IV pilus assembly protein PilM [Patescibacteria group bacterium]